MIMSIVLAAVMALSTSSWHHGKELPWYGYGFYGNRTACGQTLTRKLVGVAHRTLPCGTKVTIVWKHRVLKARVIDRGPYPAMSRRAGMPFDITAGAAKKLGCDCSNPYFMRYDFKWKRGW